MIKTPITDSVSTSITASLTASPLEDAEATGGSSASKVAGEPESFSTDSWATIQKAVQNNNTSVYNVGDTKSVTINGTDYRVRIANKTTNANCSNANYSQTACGFVVEFVDIVKQRAMNSTDTNVGGYPATLVYDYLKNTLYGQLPSDLQAAIKPTRVYLLSSVEVFGSGGYDVGEGTTTQLEYYNNSSNSKIKQYNSSNSSWWLRSATSSCNYAFRHVMTNGTLTNSHPGSTFGVAPAFRIG